MTARRRAAVLISGRGSNMRALVAAAQEPTYPAEIVGVISNRPGVIGLGLAAEQGIPTAVLDQRAYAEREAFDDALDAALKAIRADLVACAGYLRIMTPGLVERWRDRMVNIHPSLLPGYRGLRTHERALADGVRIHGCTVHFVRPEIDAGPIIAQAAVPVLGADTPETLAARVLAAEHVLYPFAFDLVASGAVHMEGERVRMTKHETPPPALIVPRF